MSPLILPIGLLVGLSLGALGGGGSILTVPALVYLLGQDPRQAGTSSLLIVGTTSLIAMVPHLRRGHVRVGPGLAFGGLGTAGSLAGAAAATRLPPAVLLTAFAALMLVVAALMVRRSRRPDGSTGPDAASASSAASVAASPRPMLTLRPMTCACRRVLAVVVTATAVGLLTGFFGVGGGFALVPALVLALSFSMPVAVGTSLLVIAVNSATALTARAVGGLEVSWALVGGFTAVAVAGSLLGSRLTRRVAPHHLTQAFAALLVLVAVYTAARSAPMLL